MNERLCYIFGDVSQILIFLFRLTKLELNNKIILLHNYTNNEMYHLYIWKVNRSQIHSNSNTRVAKKLPIQTIRHKLRETESWMRTVLSSNVKSFDCSSFVVIWVISRMFLFLVVSLYDNFRQKKNRRREHSRENSY